MNKNIAWLFLILISLGWSSTSIYVEINPDSLQKSSNISFLTSSILLNQDSLYCEQLVQEHKKIPLSTKEKPISKFKCNDLEVSEFTFFGYEDEFVNLIYKPIGSKKEFFGKAKI